MIWYEDLYLGDSIARHPGKVRRIKWKVEHNAGMVNTYLIALCRYGTGLLEILPTRELLQKHYPKQDLYVVGLAKGYREALETASGIVVDVYQNTGGFEVKKYFKHKAGERLK